METYVKPLRLPLYNIPSKKYMTEQQADQLFKNRLVVEEKMDGTFSFIAIGKFILFLEDLYRRKTVPYMVPARYALFDIYLKENGKIYILGRDDRLEVFKELLRRDPKFQYSIFMVPELERGTFKWRDDTKRIASDRSRYYDPKAPHRFMEGVVFKLENTVELTAEIREYQKIIGAKFVNDEFYQNMSAEKFTGLNRIDPRLINRL